MSYLDKYKRRMQANSGVSKDEIGNGEAPLLKNAQINRAIASQRRAFYDSPTLKYITYDSTPNTPVIQSDKYKDIAIQTFLFEPKFPVKIGTLLFDGKYTYLATIQNGEEIYPEVTAMLCNDDFDVPMGFTEHITYNRFGDPIITEIPYTEKVPASVQDKDYSTASNAIIPLPAGRINIEIPFKEKYLEHFKVNYVFDHSAGSYQVTDIREERVTPTEKYIKISAQRIQSNSEVAHDE